jgi:hypothetical protein
LRRLGVRQADAVSGTGHHRLSLEASHQASASGDSTAA